MPDFCWNVRENWTDDHGGLYGVVFLHALTWSKYPFISARGVGPSLSDYLFIRAVGLARREVLELFFLTVPEQGSPCKWKIRPSFVPANFAPELSASLAPVLYFGALHTAQSLPSESAPEETARVRPWSLKTLLT